MFNFDDVKTTSAVNSSVASLKPYGIYKVKFDGLEQTTLQGKKDPTASYSVMNMKFVSDEGNFTKNLFIPSSEDDGVRPEYTRDDGTSYFRPSRFENYKWTLLQLVQVINPEGYKKIQANSGKIKSMDEFNKFIVAIAEQKKGAEVYLKLIGRNVNNADGTTSTYAEIPNVCGLSHKNELFIVNFVSNNPNTLKFSAYEAGQKERYEKAVPTAMPTTTSPDTEEEGLDLSSLL